MLLFLRIFFLESPEDLFLLNHLIMLIICFIIKIWDHPWEGLFETNIFCVFMTHFHVTCSPHESYAAFDLAHK